MPINAKDKRELPGGFLILKTFLSHHDETFSQLRSNP